jgi:hypothetical protein
MEMGEQEECYPADWTVIHETVMKCAMLINSTLLIVFGTISEHPESLETK